MFLNCWIHHININKHYMQCKNVHDHHWFITRNTNHAYTTKISMYHLWTKELPSFLSISFLIITSAKPLTAMANKDELIHKPSKPTANERPNPINPMIFPTPAHHCRPNRCSQVQGISSCTQHFSSTPRHFSSTPSSKRKKLKNTLTYPYALYYIKNILQNNLKLMIHTSLECVTFILLT